MSATACKSYKNGDIKIYDQKKQKWIWVKVKYCKCGNSPCILKGSGKCAHCGKTVRAGIYY